MNDPPQRLRPTRNVSSGQSPTRHRGTAADDLLAYLTPATAVDALTSATGALRRCLDGASTAERDFAMRTAVASKMIYEWVDELGEWSWPSEGGPAGFEMPSGKRRRLSVQVTAPEGEDDTYMGSLLAQDVAMYERRVEEIYQDMEELAVEEIKSHILTNHIMPLSRPGTPMSESNRSVLSSVSSYNKMEDLSAAITAIVVQTLPNLAKLSRLLQIWSIRVGVLKRVPPLLLAVEDAEVALKSGWKAISVSPRSVAHTTVDPATQPQESSLTRKDFDVMKLVLEKKVARPGRSLDYMLDCLEGLPDTLPDEWLDRMEAVERDYGEWVAACERKIRETEWARAIRLRGASRTPSPEVASGEETLRAKRSNGLFVADAADEALTFKVPSNGNDVEEPSKQKRDSSQPTLASQPVGALQLVQNIVETPDAVDNNAEPASLSNDSQKVPSQDPPASRDVTPMGYDGARDSPDAEEDLLTTTTSERPDEEFTEDAYAYDGALDQADEEAELELPPLRTSGSRNSVASQASTVVRGASSHFEGLSSDFPEVSASPVIPKDRIREAEYVEDSPPSSPPIPQIDTAQVDDRESSMPQFDGAVEAGEPDDDESLRPKTPVDDSFMDDFDDSISISEMASPSKRRESTGDIQLRQQISQIIEGIPAKIKLSAEPPRINLNPPDLQLPRLRKKPSKDRFKRSASGLSSRAGTPSFTLSPAKNSRPRHQRGQQEIKVYHLSRSTGEAPIKLFIRCVGEHGERVMVRVGGGWADLSEYLKEYASHHGRRSTGTDTAKVEVRDVPRVVSSRGPNPGSSPPSRPVSALDAPISPLTMRKTRRSSGAVGNEMPKLPPATPFPATQVTEEPPPSEGSAISRSSSRLSWVEDDSSFLGLAGPSSKRVEMSQENKAWVESVKEKVRLASGERRVSGTEEKGRLGELGRVGATKRLFRRPEDRKDVKK